MKNMFDKLSRKGCDFLGVRYPIICGAMTWISNYTLVKAVSDCGAFPTLACGNMPLDMLDKELDRCLALNRPFAVNLITIAPNYKDHLDMIIKKPVSYVIFAGGIPRKSEIERVKETGKKTLSFGADKRIAQQQIRFGIDALILEGSEAGGHIGHVSLMVLLQQILFQFKDVPIFVAGGIGTGRMIAHMMLMGAAGCQLGTRFVMTEECTAHPKFKEAFLHARAREAIATPQYDSKLPVVAVRALKNYGMEHFGKLQLELLKKLESGEITRETAQYEVERYWIGALRRAVEDGDIENGSLMAGQSVGLIDDIKPMKQVIDTLILDATLELASVGDLLQP